MRNEPLAFPSAGCCCAASERANICHPRRPGVLLKLLPSAAAMKSAMHGSCVIWQCGPHPFNNLLCGIMSDGKVFLRVCLALDTRVERGFPTRLSVRSFLDIYEVKFAILSHAMNISACFFIQFLPAQYKK